ncbi:PatA/PatG family cyanobactin maturation protease [Roseomonas sp. BN140053]|uniref:PatA/PatG family cyanobactin maturation protease n=1 Tax=Roseomonas sp. BN140053 TaxID=3391898 RepID=UPI0039E94E23
MRVAVLDGPVDPALFEGAGILPAGASEHGTLVTSILSGTAAGNIPGLSPKCTILNIEIFKDGNGYVLPCSQSDLAEAINKATDLGAHIINISASKLLDAADVSVDLLMAVEAATNRGILIIAAAGNQGCSCDTIPASISGVLAVGAHDSEKLPLPISNWGQSHRSEGLIAPGLAIPGACVDGGVCRNTGTSFASAVVAGISALLMSFLLKRGEKPDGMRIKRVLLGTCDPCRPESTELCAPFLRGTLNVESAFNNLSSGFASDCNPEMPMASHTTDLSQNSQPALKGALLEPLSVNAVSSFHPFAPDGIVPADCGCSCANKAEKGTKCTCEGAKRPQLVYAIGRLAVSFTTAARRDSIWRTVNGTREGDLKSITDEALRSLMQANPYQAQAVVWTLTRSEVPMYAIVPMGAFAAETYKWLVEEWSDQDVEFVSVPGVIAGQMQLYDGMMVDILVPDLRGMFSWEHTRYTDALVAARTQEASELPEDQIRREIDRFLGKIFFRIRNRGITPEERALNAAATNAFNVSNVIVDAGREGLTLKDVSAERSPLNRPGSEYYDVLLTFFNPRDRIGTAPLLARLTIDVSDTVPVVIGEPVIWYEY